MQLISDPGVRDGLITLVKVGERHLQPENVELNAYREEHAKYSCHLLLAQHPLVSLFSSFMEETYRSWSFISCSAYCTF